MDVTDDILKHESAADQSYKSDSVEIYIDADDAKAPSYGQNDYQYAFTWDKSAPTMQGPSTATQGVEYTLVTTEKGYAVEVKFPWSTLGAKPSAGSKVGLDVQVNDSDVGGNRKSKLAWHATEDDRDDPSSTRPHDRAGRWDIARRHPLVGCRQTISCR